MNEEGYHDVQWLINSQKRNLGLTPFIFTLCSTITLYKIYYIKRQYVKDFKHKSFWHEYITFIMHNIENKQDNIFLNYSQKIFILATFLCSITLNQSS